MAIGAFQEEKPGSVEHAQERWYAVRTRPRHEKKVATELCRRGITNYVPVLAESHRWSDRRRVIEVPIFPGYAFLKAALSPDAYVAVLCINGILHFVGSHHRGTPIPDKQIDDIRKLLDGRAPVTVYPFLKIGQKVVITGGALDGVEGFLLTIDGKNRLVISVDGIQRSLAITLEGYRVRPA
jgi:transcription antitermination factor NusG